MLALSWNQIGNYYVSRANQLWMCYILQSSMILHTIYVMPWEFYWLRKWNTIDRVPYQSSAKNIRSHMSIYYGNFLTCFTHVQKVFRKVSSYQYFVVPFLHFLIKELSQCFHCGQRNLRDVSLVWPAHKYESMRCMCVCVCVCVCDPNRI